VSSSPHDDLAISPESLWHKIKKWPSAILAEIAIRIQEELKARVARRKQNAE